MNFKKTLKIFTLSIFICFVFLSFNTPTTKACSCIIDNDSAVSAFYGSDAVFSGRATDINIGNITFEVFKSYKGENKNIVTIENAGGNCGYYFNKGKDYLVYASRQDNGNLTTSTCDRTTQLEDSENDIQLFNSGLKIKFLLFLENPTGGPLVIALVFALIIYALYSKFKRP